MTSTAKKLLGDALRLSDCDRADLAVSLIEGLDSRADAEAEWNAEIHRLIQGLDNHCVASVPWTEARRIIREGPDARCADCVSPRRG